MICRNGGTCVDGVNNFICSCPIGYSGVFCEKGSPDRTQLYYFRSKTDLFFVSNIQLSIIKLVNKVYDKGNHAIVCGKSPRWTHLISCTFLLYILNFILCMANSRDSHYRGNGRNILGNFILHH